MHDSPDRSSRSSVHCYQTLKYRISGKPPRQVCHIGTLEEVTDTLVGHNSSIEGFSSRPDSLSSAEEISFFSSLKTLLMLTEAIGPLVRVNVPGFTVGRFSGDPHWPVLGDH